MNDWPPGRGKSPEPDRIALDTDSESDLDEALQEAVQAVEAVEAAAAADEDGPVPGKNGPEAAAPPPVDEREAETDAIETVESLRLENEELRQRSTRTLADFDNYRKRIERERQAQERYNGMDVLRSLLDIVDNLERAVASDGPVDDLKTGVEMTLRQAEVLLERYGVSRIDAEGAVFDPSLHEAVSRLEQEGLSEPQVTAVLQSGYQMHERLLRPVRVAVAVPAAQPAELDGGEDAGGEG